MTLLAFANYGDRVEVVTDTVQYTHDLVAMRPTTKHLPLSHFDALVLCAGDARYTTMAKLGLFYAASQSFDELAEEAPDMLADVWSHVTDGLDDDEHIYDSTIVLLGWSESAAAFVSYLYASEQGSKRVAINRPFVMPAPFDVRPSGMEARRFREEYSEVGNINEAVETWTTKRPPLKAPRSDAEWIDLAERSRSDRAVNADDHGLGSYIIAGDLMHTRLTRGELLTRRIHTFDDTGDDFAKMVAWTSHPVALVRPCCCDSGKTWGDCRDSPEHDAWLEAP